jgi:hypothetical protein
MSTFLKIKLGSRGLVKNVEAVNTTYELIKDEYNNKYKDLSTDLSEGNISTLYLEEFANICLNEDPIDILYLEEFADICINETEGTVVYGFSEEPSTYFINFDNNSNICNELATKWSEKNEDFDEHFENAIYQFSSF